MNRLIPESTLDGAVVSMTLSLRTTNWATDPCGVEPAFSSTQSRVFGTVWRTRLNLLALHDCHHVCTNG